MSISINHPAERLTVTQAAAQGVPALVRAAESGTDVLVSRHGTPVAWVVGAQRAAELTELQDDLRNIALLLARAATDDGTRTSLDDALAAFGFERADFDSPDTAE